MPATKTDVAREIPARSPFAYHAIGASLTVASIAMGASAVLLLAASIEQPLASGALMALAAATPAARVTLVVAPLLVVVLLGKDLGPARGAWVPALAAAAPIAPALFAIADAGAASWGMAWLALAALTVSALLFSAAALLGLAIAGAPGAIASAALFALAAPAAALDPWRLIDDAARGHVDAAVLVPVILATVVLGAAAAYAARAPSPSRANIAALIALAAALVVANAATRVGGRVVFAPGAPSSLPEALTEALRALPEDVRVTALLSGLDADDDAIHAARAALAAMEAAAGPRLVIEELDPLRAPARAAALRARAGESAALATDVLVIEAGPRRRAIDLPRPLRGLSAHERGTLEAEFGRAVAMAVLWASRPQPAVIAWAEGHGESPPPPGLRSALEPIGVTLVTWAVDDEPAPERASTIVVASPRLTWEEPASRALMEHLARGGGLVALLPPRLLAGGTALATTGLETVLAPLGIATADAVLCCDARSATIRSEHEAVRALAGLPLATSLARPLLVRDGAAVLATIDGDAWGETNLASLAHAPTRDASDLAAPLVVAAAVHSPPGARVVVVGAGDPATLEGSARGANTAFLVDTILWSAGAGRTLGMAADTFAPARFVPKEGGIRRAGLFALCAAPFAFIVIWAATGRSGLRR